MNAELERRLARLEDREAIRELVARYGFAVDDRDIVALTDCFTADSRGLHRAGEENPRDRGRTIAQYHERFAVIGPSNHFTHNHIIRIDPEDPDRASGQLNGHAELARDGEAFVCALRYEDEYRRGADGRWRIADRTMTFLYYLRVAELQAALGEPLRVRAYATASAADWPEGVDTYHSFYASDRKERE